MLPGPVPEPRRGAVAAAFLGLSAAVLIPIALTNLPPILDYPNHLARMHILAALPDSPALARWYETAWAPLPNLALDAIVPWIARLIPVEIAMRLFLGGLLIALAGGCLVLHRAAFRRWSLVPLAGFLLLYNRMLLWGFLNYLAGLALMLWALAIWIALEGRPAWFRLLVGAFLATALYFAHLAAFGCYGLALLAYAAARPDGGRSLAGVAAAAATLLPGALFFLSSPISGVVAGIAYGNILRKLDLPVSIFDNYNRIFDGLTFAIVLIAVIYGLIRGAIRVHPRLRWSLLLVILAYFAVPSRLLSASGLDHRLPVAIALLFAASTDWGAIGRKARLAVTWSALGLLTARLAVICVVWLNADALYAGLAPALDDVPEGGAMAVATPAGSTQAGGVPLLHFPILAAARRDAFVPTIFADPAQQPIRLTKPAARLATEAEPERLWNSLRDGTLPSLPGYDVLAVVDPPRPIVPSRLPGSIVFDSPRLVLIRLHGAVEPPQQ